MRDRTASRNYSPGREEFRRVHQRHRNWGLTRRHAERLRHLRDRPAGSRPGDELRRPSSSRRAGVSASGGPASRPAPRQVPGTSQEPPRHHCQQPESGARRPSPEDRTSAGGGRRPSPTGTPVRRAATRPASGWSVPARLAVGRWSSRRVPAWLAVGWSGFGWSVPARLATGRRSSRPVAARLAVAGQSSRPGPAPVAAGRRSNRPVATPWEASPRSSPRSGRRNRRTIIGEPNPITCRRGDPQRHGRSPPGPTTSSFFWSRNPGENHLTAAAAMPIGVAEISPELSGQSKPSSPGRSP
jgi:hypothetical protein